MFLAYGYIAASIVGMLIYLHFIAKACRQVGWFDDFSFRRMVVPAREVFAFTLPMLAADVAVACTESAGALVLGYFHNLSDVATFTAALPLAVLNQLVMRNFALLYTPAASRLFARKDFASINDLYWHTAVWMAILTFPIFALTFSASRSLTQFLYGPRYDATAHVLPLLAFGEYVNVATGFNGLTLRVLNRVRYILTISAISTVVAFALNILFVPTFGAIGAAVATCITMVLGNVMKQFGLRFATGVSLFDSRYGSSYVAITACAAGLVAVQWMMPNQPLIVLSLAAVASLIALQLCKRVMKVAEIFPEVLRVPVLGAWLA
jgi:O-antigen/teichoic acid export membrane protein